MYKNEYTLGIHQHGIGLLEVLIALLLLAVAVLGFAALQFRALDASAEALNRSQAVMVMQDLSENMRINRSASQFYPQKAQSQSAQSSAPKNCYTANCTPEEIATFDVIEAKKQLDKLGMHMIMADCPGVVSPSTRQCLFVAWGDTTVSGTNYSDCMNGSGIYQSETCLMMEMYEK